MIQQNNINSILRYFQSQEYKDKHPSLPSIHWQMRVIVSHT